MLRERARSWICEARAARKLSLCLCSLVVAKGGVILYTAHSLVVLIPTLELSVLVIMIAFLAVREVPIEDEAAEVAPS